MRRGLVGASIVGMGLVLAAARGVPAQAPANWLTDGADPQRTAWQRDETVLTPANVRDLTLLWSMHLDNAPRQMHALYPPLVIGRVATPAGSRQVGIVAGVSDNVFGVDLDRGSLLWAHHFDEVFRPAPDPHDLSVLCPGGQTAMPVVAPTDEPGRYLVYAASWDGRLRTLDAATGAEIAPPAPFMPSNGKPYALNLWRGVIYTTTAQGCGGNPNRIYAFDLSTRTPQSFAPARGGMWGRRGPSIGADGTIFTGTKNDGDPGPFNGEAVVSVSRNPATGRLALKDYFTPLNAVWMAMHDLDVGVTGPVFSYRGRELIAQSSKECRVWLLDTASLGGEEHHTAVAATPVMCNDGASFESAGVWGAIATWEDSDGTRWIVSPFWGPPSQGFHAPIEYGPVVNGAVAAFRLEASAGGGLHLAPAWMSRDMNRADPPVVASGVVFGYGSGESTTQRWGDPRHKDGAEGRIEASTHAVLYALDGRTGRELWSSGDQIRSWNHFSGLSVANGRVYIATYDGMLYCFGLRG